MEKLRRALHDTGLAEVRRTCVRWIAFGIVDLLVMSILVDLLRR